MRFLVGFLGLSLLVACVGDAPAPAQPDGGGTDGGGNDVQQGNDSAIDVATDSPLVCDGGSTVIACNGSCVDISGDVTNCGACGHDCGGGQCVLGECKPVSLVTTTYPAFDVDATNLYFVPAPTNTTDIVKCPSSGCKLAPTSVGSPGFVAQSNQGGNVMLMGLNVAFFGELASNPGRPRLFACDPIGGCSTSPITLQNAGLQSFGYDLATSGNDAYWTFYKNLVHASCSAANTCSAAENLIAGTAYWPRVGLSADSSGVYYIDPTTHYLTKCPPSGTCTPTTLWTGSNAASLNTAAFGGKVYVLDSNSSGYSKGTITECPNTGTCTTPNVLVNLQPYPTILRVDAQGIYWYNADTSEMKTCPLSGCKPSPRTLATNVPGVTMMRTDAKFVYYATNTAIYRVAK